MKQPWIKAAWASAAALLSCGAPAQAQYQGNPYPYQPNWSQGPSCHNGTRYGSMYYGQPQSHANPAQYGNGYAWQGPGYYNQPGQPVYYGQGGYNQNPSGWNQSGTWAGNQNSPWVNRYNGPPPDGYHYDRGYRDGYHHGYHASSRGAPGQPMGPHPGAFQFTRIRGELQQIKQAQLPGLEEPMLFGLMMTDQGQRVLVAFGPAKGVKDVKLQQGQSITATGEMCRTCNQPVMLAEQVRTQGKTMAIQAFQNIEPQRESVQGKLVKVHNVRLPGMREAIRIGVVKTKQGQEAIVNLGSADQEGELDLEEGAQVSAQGFGFEFDGKQVLFADRIRANGQTLTLYE